MLAIGIIIGIFGTLAIEGLIISTLVLDYQKSRNK